MKNLLKVIEVVEGKYNGSKIVAAELTDGSGIVFEGSISLEKYDQDSASFISCPIHAAEENVKLVELFGFPFEELESSIGVEIEVPTDKNYNFYIEEKFKSYDTIPEKYIGKRVDLEITGVSNEFTACIVEFKIEGVDGEFAKKYQKCAYDEIAGSWAPEQDPNLVRDAGEKFKNNHGVDIASCSSIVGSKLNKEVCLYKGFTFIKFNEGGFTAFPKLSEATQFATTKKKNLEFLVTIKELTESVTHITASYSFEGEDIVYVKTFAKGIESKQPNGSFKVTPTSKGALEAIKKLNKFIAGEEGTEIKPLATLKKEVEGKHFLYNFEKMKTGTGSWYIAGFSIAE